MCEIQFVMSKTLATDSMNNFTELLSKGSQSNGDATGVFGEHFTWKIGQAYEDFKKGKVKDLQEHMREYGTNWLVGHNRWTTQGSEKIRANNHPFENATCVVVHNGMISNDDNLSRTYELKYKAETDSAVVPALIEMFTKNGEEELSAIKKTAELLEGSYSIFVLMKETKNLYYFKNGSTSFQFMKIKDRKNRISFYGSTCKSSLEELGSIKTDGMFDADIYKGRSFGEPDSGQIYRIVYKEKMDIYKEENGKFEVRARTYNKWSDKGVTDWGYYGGVNYTNKKHDAYKNRGSRYEELDGGMTPLGTLDGVVIDDLMEDCILEIDYMESLSGAGSLATELLGYDLVWDDNAEVVALREVKKSVGHYLMQYLNATEWYDDKSSDECANYSIRYGAIYKMEADGFIYKSGDTMGDNK